MSCADRRGLPDGERWQSRQQRHAYPLVNVQRWRRHHIERGHGTIPWGVVSTPNAFRPRMEVMKVLQIDVGRAGAAYGAFAST